MYDIPIQFLLENSAWVYQISASYLLYCKTSKVVHFWLTDSRRRLIVHIPMTSLIIWNYLNKVWTTQVVQYLDKFRARKMKQSASHFHHRRVYDATNQSISSITEGFVWYINCLSWCIKTVHQWKGCKTFGLTPVKAQKSIHKKSPVSLKFPSASWQANKYIHHSHTFVPLAGIVRTSVQLTLISCLCVYTILVWIRSYALVSGWYTECAWSVHVIIWIREIRCLHPEVIGDIN